jgi:hypothetical protein
LQVVQRVNKMRYGGPKHRLLTREQSEVARKALATDANERRLPLMS